MGYLQHNADTQRFVMYRKCQKLTKIATVIQNRKIIYEKADDKKIITSSRCQTRSFWQ